MEGTPAQYPLLAALYGRGGASYTGAPLSSLLVEVRSGKLYISGVTPLRIKDDRYIGPGKEYQYILDSPEAEGLLAALSRRSQKRPEAVIAEEFEFSRPCSPLGDYLDGLGIKYDYYVAN